MELYTDTYYIQRIQAGETACFACLLDKYSRPVYSLIFKIIQNREITEEITQDVFIKVYQKLSSFRGDCSLSTWIYKIAYNSVISYTRKKRQEFVAIEEIQINNVSEEEITKIVGYDNHSVQLEKLETALTQLPPDERAIILLFYWKEKSIEEIVNITGLSSSNVKTKLYRIRKKLFVLIKRMEE